MMMKHPMKIIAPTFRQDLERHGRHLAEEVARFYRI